MAENKKVRTTSFFNSRLISIVSIALVLFLLGVIFLMGLVGNKLSVYVKENISFSILLKDNQDEADAQRMQKSLAAQPFIKSTVYISKEQAAKELKEELGEDPETFLGFNPLQASIEAKLHSAYANPDSLKRVEEAIMSYSSVSDVLYRKDMMEMVHNNMKKVGIILLSLAVILMIISFVLIGNTIKLLIYSKRFLIHTMKLVGATAGFIRKPFIIYNMISGIIAAILAILSQISFQLPGDIPITLQTFAVVLIGIILGPKLAPLTVTIYILIGTIGFPVFANAKGGAGVLFGPTGGYLLGFLLMAFIIGFGSRKNIIISAVSVVIGLIVCHSCGLAVYALITHSFLPTTPFLFAKDLATAISALLLGRELVKRLAVFLEAKEPVI